MAKNKLGIGMIIGAVTGVIAGLFLSDKPGKKLRDSAMATYEDIKKTLEENEPEKAVAEIFGKVTDEGKDIFFKVKDEVARNLSQLHKDLSKIDKKKYEAVVRDVVDSIKKSKKVPDTIAPKLAQYLKEDYKKIQKPTSSKAKTKTSKKITKKATPKKSKTIK